MLKSLSIQQYAIIDSLEIEFSRGLNIITGETGAGKSIILGALSLLLGERADSTSIRNNSKKCVIEASIDITHLGLQNLFSELDIEYSDTSIIRRELLTGGKSRAFVNDSPVTLNILSTLMNFLIDLHRQHETLDINKTDFQISLLDSISLQNDKLNNYQNAFSEYKKKLSILNNLIEKQTQLDAENDFNIFQLNELEEANLIEGELEKLEADLKKQENAEGLEVSINSMLSQINEGEINLISRLKDLSKQLNSLLKIDTSLGPALTIVKNIIEEIKEVESLLENELNHLDFDAEKLSNTTSRLDEIYRLQKKHRVNSVNELIIIRNSLSDKINQVKSNEDGINALKEEVENLLSHLHKHAETLSKKRNEISSSIEKKMIKLLKEVGMPESEFEISIQKRKTLNENGIDDVQILFSANKGSKKEAIQKVASGGELSRLMLCLKSLIAGSTQLPTLIFDEVDTGISGETAQRVGKLMKELSTNHQMICITHLPQIAAKADNHYFVYKEIKNNITNTQLRILDNKERILEIAKMLSGEKPGNAALQNAKELIEY
jgi:DNA repair protein RecN (Recombination protein N)